MITKASQYIELINSYLDDNIDFSTFFDSFNEKYVEENGLDENLFKILEVIWGDIDATTNDRSLIEEYPTQYIDEDELMTLLKRNTGALTAYIQKRS